MAVWILILFVILAVLWLKAGRQMTWLADRLITVRHVSMPLRHFKSDGGFRVGTQTLTFCGLDNLPTDVKLVTDASYRVVLCTGGRSFTLGPRTNPIDPRGRPEILFDPDPGDRISLRSSGSLLPWPTPSEGMFLPGTWPKWKRYAYYRLVWTKASGASLEMKWRYEQLYYSRGGWTEPLMTYMFHTGLMSVDIDSK